MRSARNFPGPPVERANVSEQGVEKEDRKADREGRLSLILSATLPRALLDLRELVRVDVGEACELCWSMYWEW